MSGDMPDFYVRLCNGDNSAVEWLCMFHDFMHALDDICDLPDYSTERLMRCFIMANDCYSHPFYVKNSAMLQPAILVATAIWTDSIDWEKSHQPLWKRWFSDVMRHAGNNVAYTVALICGGYDNMAKSTAPMMAASYIYHKDKYGEPQ